ncbi:MAG: CdaR family protein, partial [Chloroflexota bacterium]|nr:CdaR family protein [Chloroflexota bacterium]
MRLLLRNWHLKLSAVLLATVLYTGLVFSGSFSEGSTELAIGTSGQPDNAFVLSGAPGTVAIRYRAPNETTPNLSPESFRATVDLSTYDMERAPDPQNLPVEVVSVVEGVEIISRDPATVTVELDRLDEKTVPVVVDYGEIPDRLEVADPEVSAETVQVRGAASLVSRVDRVVARVIIDQSGIDVERSVPLEPVDIEGQPVQNVEPQPATVGVRIDVQATETNKTVPVRPDIGGGTPAPGFALESLTVEPSVVTLRGLPEVLSEIDEVLTEPLNIEGVSADQTFDAVLVLGDDVRLAQASAQPTVAVTATIVPSVSSRAFVVGVVCEGAGDNACLPAIDQMTLTLSGPGGTLSGLDAGDVTPTVDAAGLAPGTYDVDPSINGLPDGVEVLGITPGTVSITIVAPATPTPTPTPSPTPAPTVTPT